MKLIDEKGRLFGKLNLIDLLVVLLVIVVIAAVVWKIGGPKIEQTIQSVAPAPRMEYEVICANVSNDVCNYALTMVGDQLMASGEMLDGKIVNVETEPNYIVTTDAAGNPVNAPNPKAKDLRFTIECAVSQADYAYVVGTQEIRVGKSHIVKTVNLEINGTITRIDTVNADE